MEEELANLTLLDEEEASFQKDLAVVDLVSRWLREADGSQCLDDNMESFSQGNNFNVARDSKRNFGGDFRNQVSNLNLIPMGSNQQFPVNEQSNWRNKGKDISNMDRLVNGPMDLVFVAENDPITVMEGKKR
ncbi:hypothetical protein PVK06_034310 [Gossypium arboreum]|uniref:Uncharacterized protein n=1 Tax=Gossypium arboreum TaxID=29729 RepID=A0ABR0NEQ0_GOSAR|nr:hypothetical protein PVK06_034310 [Gossypium arboreum]